MNTAFVNGEFCSLAEAKISVFDRGFLFGDAVYEVLPVYHGEPYFVERHLARLNANLEKIKIETPDYDWHEIIGRLILENGGGDLQIYIHVTRGNQGVRKHDITSPLPPSVIGFTIHNPFPTHTQKEKGLSAQLLEDIRWTRCDIKTTSLLGNILLNDEAMASGYQTSILYREDYVTEGSTANIFIVTPDGVIKTPPLNNLCLPGITREVACSLIHQLNLPFQEAPIKTSELFEAKEIWITSTTKEVFPVTKINESLVHDGHAGEFWRTVNKSYQQLIS